MSIISNNNSSSPSIVSTNADIGNLTMDPDWATTVGFLSDVKTAIAPMVAFFKLDETAPASTSKEDEGNHAPPSELNRKGKGPMKEKMNQSTHEGKKEGKRMVLEVQESAGKGSSPKKEKLGQGKVLLVQATNLASHLLQAFRAKYGEGVDMNEEQLKELLMSNSKDSPNHAPCGPAQDGASLLIIPHLGRANAIPDATAHVDLNINGKPFKFKGVGYHDSNFGDVPLDDVLGTWYWGHARVGPYSLVWFDTLDKQGMEHQSGYAIKDGVVLGESCGTMSVRPVGPNTIYPPVPFLEPTGFHIVYDMGVHGILEVNATNHETFVSQPTYTRWSGSTVGGDQRRRDLRRSGDLRVAGGGPQNGIGRNYTV
ncbi:hypothetical protein DACRYDRAFT_107953 [Dacryopinax primogenitus]|uniref:AsqO/PenF-like C-terminal domain-containing protein n=1 Tax=Dacryopinax primogenitus (strain DJM 731) TaxID=1858805 RepID=M5FUI0_DACPD|nr:uncharacterized protein DACRYDRAFT_107953 [Dacryopinax primogenitus]EJU01401.1 hypothetical protein DACRYDRAFT_107953 [Dacryopinax primogenitus]